MKSNFRTMPMQVREVSEQERTVKLSFSSEKPVERFFGQEILCHDEGCVDLNRLQNVGSVLFHHGRDPVYGSLPIIGGINKLSFTAPDWVPGIGGETVGFNLPTIPLLAQGGVATRPTLAMVGEGWEHEAILPLSKLKGLLGLSQTSLAATMERLTRRPAAAAAGGSSYHYSPQIIFQGGSRQEQDQVLADDKKRFERWLKEREEHDRRTRIKPKK